MTKDKEGHVTIIIREVPEDLRRAFKSKCAAIGSTMASIIIQLMKEFVYDREV